MLKITEKEKPTKNTFGSLDVGDVFEFTGLVFMKVKEETDVDNAVKLSDGDSEWRFDTTHFVRFLDAELIIH